jgi:hypothetical protein
MSLDDLSAAISSGAAILVSRFIFQNPGSGKTHAKYRLLCASIFRAYTGAPVVCSSSILTHRNFILNYQSLSTTMLFFRRRRRRCCCCRCCLHEHLLHRFDQVLTPLHNRPLQVGSIRYLKTATTRRKHRETSSIETLKRIIVECA